MSDAMRSAVVDLVSADPLTGDLMEGTGGCRKLRVARPGQGKSGGFRVVTAFGGGDVPVFLLAAFGKNEKANLTRAERNALAKVVQAIFEEYRANRPVRKRTR